MISIHAFRGGSDHIFPIVPLVVMNFNPRFPWGKRPLSTMYQRFPGIFQSTLSVGEATCGGPSGRCFMDISIHAFRGGSDHRKISIYVASELISIHAFRGGSDCAVNPAPIYRTWHHGFREPGFSGFFHRRFPCFFPLGTGGSHLPNVRHIAASHFFYYTISNGCRLLFPCLYILKVP